MTRNYIIILRSLLNSQDMVKYNNENLTMSSVAAYNGATES